MRDEVQLSDYEKRLKNNIHNGLNKLPDYMKTTYNKLDLIFKVKSI